MANSVLRLRTRLSRHRLDGMVARAVQRPNDETLALRTAQLRGSRERLRVAGELERLLGQTQSAPRWSAAVPMDLEAVRIARPALQQLIRALESGRDVDARGVALASRLLSDACSPLFLPPGPNPVDHEGLYHAARRALLALQPGGRGLKPLEIATRF